MNDTPLTPKDRVSPLDRLISFCLQNKLIVVLFVVAITAWGAMVAPFDWDLSGLPRDPVPVDAIPDIGENQQIVFTEWMGRSPQDVEDQITYPLTVALLGVPGVKSIRSYSFFGFSSIYVIFKDDVEFYWSRSRILEKLNSLPRGTLPDNVQPALGPDATALGQVFWYTLEGRDLDGNPTGGWDLHELRTIQDWYVRYGLSSAEGVAEVASIGGFVQEYQIDVDPEALRAHNVTLPQVYNAVRGSNVDVGARTIEINNVEYVIRGLGFIETLADIENITVKSTDGVPLRVSDIATVGKGPAIRRGVLDKGGAEVVGGVVVVRYGENPLAAINNVKAKIAEISPGLPTKTLDDGTVSQVTIVPFYDRTGLINETLGTLNTALTDEILATIIVVLIMVFHLRSSLLISGLLPLAVLMAFIGMKLFHVDANIVALSGIAIAIGTIVDMGIVICENILKHLDDLPPGQSRLRSIFNATKEVGGAVTTAIATTVVSFLPVFTMIGPEGKLFKPLAYTKTFALIASVVIALTIIPALAHLIFGTRLRGRRSDIGGALLILAGLLVAAIGAMWVGLAVTLFGIFHFLRRWLPPRIDKHSSIFANYTIAVIVAIVLSAHWLPLGPGRSLLSNSLFVLITLGSILLIIHLFRRYYEPILRWCLDHKAAFLTIPLILILLGGCIWLGFDSVFGFIPDTLSAVGIPERWTRGNALYTSLSHEFPGLGKEFMPPLDEGAFLLMPTTMPHASIGEAYDVLQKQDMAISAIPEVESVVGKIGRVDSPLDPAPISMVETVINYKSEYITDESGRILRFRYDHDAEEYARDKQGDLIPDSDGEPYRNWREHIESPDDIWDEIVSASKILGTTSAPKLQPIETRLVMLQTGMRAPMGIKVRGPDLETIETVGLEIEQLLKQVPSVKPATVLADRIVGKPYLEIDIDRMAIGRYGLHIRDVQDVIETAIGGKPITTTVEGRERYNVRIRYQRERRNQIEELERVLIAGSNGVQVPLSEVTDIEYVRGPQVIKSENTFLTGYVVFDRQSGMAEVEVVEQARRFLEEKRESGEFVVPAGVSYEFSGSYENQVRSEKKLMVVLPLALFIIFVILYFQFRSVSTTMMVFSGVFVAWAGGFLMIWLYGQSWFMDFSFLGANLRDLFQMHTINLSVAVWVGFLALFGIATDDGVILATYLKQSFERNVPQTVGEIREATVEAGKRRIRPCLMTTATTLIALIPILTSTGRGADVMVPMAIPSFGGMTVVLITVFVVPTLYAALAEWKLKRSLITQQST
ncbi:MAG: AcrB/AcrD/AcrF family protein [candidate division Zixibacteria bacterium]|nr:AcrB/AcrD/AcrF family protein [candidate division Zixibacteria bacterium]